MMKKLFLLLTGIFCTFQLTAQQKDTVKFMSLNVLNYPNGCGTSTVNREDTLRKIVQYAKPDIFTICELQEEFGADSILNKSMNVQGNSTYARANWVPNASSSNNFQNMLFYNTDKLTLKSQDEIVTSLRDINHYVLYVNDPYLPVHQDTIFFEVYMAHLKAGTGSSNETERNNMAQLIRNYIDNRPSDRNHILCGDFNVYDDQEPAYQTLTSSGTNPFFDPINQAGNWHDNSTYAAIHTQSPRSADNWDCGATGGMDDRFDQILVTQNVMNGNDSAMYIPGSYKALGNDGQHFNDDLIAAPSNAVYPDSLVNAIYWMSDHLPVVMDVEISKAWDDIVIESATTMPSCNGDNDGSATANVSGGTTPYSYQWDANAGSQTTQTATNLSAGTYCVTVTDDNGYIDSSCVTVNEPATLSLSSSSVPETGNCDGEAIVSANGGTPAYNYQWDAAANNQSGDTASNLCNGDYWCMVTDANGCVDSIKVNVSLDSSSAIINGISDIGIKIYPNPFKNDLCIDLSEYKSSSSIKIQIVDESGKITEEFLVEQHSDQSLIVFEDLDTDAGNYFLRIITSKQTHTVKLVKR